MSSGGYSQIFHPLIQQKTLCLTSVLGLCVRTELNWHFNSNLEFATGVANKMAMAIQVEIK